MKIITEEKQIDAVLTKGVKDIFPNKQELKNLLMSGKRIRLYTGIDPTANFIHMGHMIWMRKLAEFQKLGHEVIFLIGGFTAMIGDPDKKYSREPLTKEQVEKNFGNYKSDASKFLDFDNQENPVKILNNYDWLSKLTLEQWIEISSNVTLQHILSHDMFRQRYESQTPIRLHEIMYPLMQGYDGVEMRVDLEIGGSDQTFNMLTGRILERNILDKEKHVLTMKLLTDNSGNKMGKTTNNSISFKDDPNDVYGKVMSFNDEMLGDAYELLSNKTLEEIEKIEKDAESNPMEAKKLLAFELTELMHSTEAAQNAKENFEKTVQNKEAPKDIPTVQSSEIDDISDFLVNQKLVQSKSELRRLVEQGGVKRNDAKIESLEELELNSGDILQIGKRKWLKVI